MLAFALSLDDLVIASFTTGPGATTLPIRIYSEVRLGVKPEMNAVCSIMIAVVGVAVIAASLLAKLNAARGTPARAELRSIPALARRPEQIEQEPDRHDHQRAEQQVRQRPGEPWRARSSIRSGESPAVLISSSGVMPKWARIVPTISEATSTLTRVRVRRLSILRPVAGENPR